MMKRLFICALLIVAGLISNAQSDTSLVSLEKRLNEYMLISKQLDFERLFDYLHPNIFKIAPRKQMVEVFKKAYYNENMSIAIDSIAKKRVHESFQFNGSNYRLIDYSTVLSLTMKDQSKMDDSSFVETMLDAFTEAFAGKTVTYNKDKKSFVISGDDKLIAIKDTPKSTWMFLGYQKGSPYATKIIPEEVIKHFRLEEN